MQKLSNIAEEYIGILLSKSVCHWNLCKFQLLKDLPVLDFNMNCWGFFSKVKIINTNNPAVLIHNHDLHEALSNKSDK